jgi:hypothetical protein
MNDGAVFVMLLAAIVGVVVMAALAIEATVGVSRDKRLSRPVQSRASPARPVK